MKKATYNVYDKLDELNLKEIGKVLGVSESRVCQINNQAMLRLKSRLLDFAPSE